MNNSKCENNMIEIGKTKNIKPENQVGNERLKELLERLEGVTFYLVKVA